MASVSPDHHRQDPRAYQGALGPVKAAPPRMSRYLALDDFELAARRHLPKVLYEFVRSGTETEASVRGNHRAFEEYGLVARVLRDVSQRDQTTQVLGKRYAAPFGIAPMGSSSLCAHRGDLALGRAAAASNLPMVLSAASLISLEEVKREAATAWYQAYLAADPTHIEPLLGRVAAAGYDTFVITADVPVPANRENNLRTGYRIPLAVTPRIACDALLHPRWLLHTWIATLAKHGMPHFENFDATRGPSLFARDSAYGAGRRDQLSWRHVELIRRRWSGKLVVKGMTSPLDARIARESGVDGVILSNHGGRQLDGAISPLHMLSEVAAEAKGMAVMLDGGVRRGTDVLKALALGAHFVFVGRPMLYAAAAEGEEGVR